MLPVEQPIKTYTGLDGKPLDNGSVYFGEPGQDAIAHPVTVYWDAAGTLPAAQPLRTVSGYIVNDSGSPANVFFDGAYSTLVQDSKGRQVFYAQTSDSFSIATIVSNFLANIAASAGSSLIGFIAAGVGAVMRKLQDKVREIEVSVTDFGADPTGAEDSTAAFQAAVNASRFIRIPGGTYKIAGTISKTTSASMRIRGDGIGVTVVQQWEDADLFDINNAGGSGQFIFEHLTLAPEVAMTEGAAIRVQNNTALPSLLVNDVFIGTSEATNFAYGIRMKNCGEALFQRVVQYGSSQTNFVPWEVTSTMASTVVKWFYCSVYSAECGVHVINSMLPGIEGLQFYGCDFVNVQYGVHYENTYGPTYLPPQLTWIGGHISANFRNFDLSNMSQATIFGALLYNTGAGPFINLNTCSDYKIIGNTFKNIGDGTAIGIDIYTSADPINAGIISDNSFDLNESAYCVGLNASRIIENLKLRGLQRISGARTLYVHDGYMDPTVSIEDCTPDQEDVYESVSVQGNLISLTGTRAKFFLLSGTGSPVVVTELISRFDGDEITLKSDDTTITLQHNASSNHGFLLKGGLDFTFSAGSLITLRKANGGYWTEISRSV